MVVLALIAAGLSVGMLVSVNRTVAKNGGPSGKAVLLCFLFTGAPLCHLFYMLPLLAQGLLMALTLPLSSTLDRGPKLYRDTSILIAVAVWVTAFVNAVRVEQEYSTWRLQYPVESMADRVPAPNREGRASWAYDGGPPWRAVFAGSHLPPMPPIWEEFVGELPRPVMVNDEIVSHSYISGGRDRALHDLHEMRITLFHQAAGFGITRMGFIGPQAEHFAPDPTPPVPQPERYDPSSLSLGDEMRADPQKPFGQLHAASLLDFVNPDGWGYVKSRQAVAGFRPHRFSKVPEPVEMWEVRRVELVGLLLHEKPAVYLSDHLPRMDELKDGATRPPDSFEAEGLKEIRGGHDLFARGGEDDVRMVGAIRSVEQCVQCHGGSRGDLLGAFSYRLRREGTK